jgi:O-succinylbenzoic acid--CoA ligase
MLKYQKFHRDFKLNGESFEDNVSLLKYATTLTPAISSFLKDWFSDATTIAIKTSGSTGVPKRILLQKDHMLNSAKATGDFFKLESGTRALLCLPADYIAGKMMLVRALSLGWHIEVAELSSNPLENCALEYDFAAMVPLQVKGAIKKINQIKTLIVGGGEVSASLQKTLQDVSTEVYATYGMTETVTHIAVRKLNHGEWKGFKTLPKITISTDHRKCLVINAPHICKEQVYTNDVVELLSENSFLWKGRYDNVINSGGIKLFPEEIERKLSPYIDRRFFVAGIKDAVLGEKLVLLIEGDAYKTPEQMFADLGKYEIPKNNYFVAEFIETATGKIQRKKTVKHLFKN